MTADRDPHDAPASDHAPVSLVNRPGIDAGSESGPAARTDLLAPSPSGWTDVLTGTDGPRYWDRVMTGEQARLRRYGRPATIALAEIAGLDALATRWGADVADQVFVKLARALAGEVRTSDVIARVDRTRFAIFLTETDEIAAINFVERARASCEANLGLARDVVRLGLGWASAPPKTSLAGAYETAAGRLAAELATPG